MLPSGIVATPPPPRFCGGGVGYYITRVGPQGRPIRCTTLTANESVRTAGGHSRINPSQPPEAEGRAPQGTHIGPTQSLCAHRDFWWTDPRPRA